MRGLRAVCAALLLVAFTLGGPLHGAIAHGTGAHTTHAAPGHVKADGKSCRDCPAKTGAGVLCQMACAAAAAVLDPPFQLEARSAHAMRFPASLPAAPLGAAIAPDPFPPKPSRIA